VPRDATGFNPSSHSKRVLDEVSSGSRLRDFLYRFADREVLYVHDNFSGLSMDTTRWAAVKSGTNNTTFAVPSPPLSGGGLYAYGSTDNAPDVNVWYGPAILDPTKNGRFEIVFQTSRWSPSIHEIGLQSARAAETTAAVTAITNANPPVPTFDATITNAVLYVDASSYVRGYPTICVKGNATGQGAYGRIPLGWGTTDRLTTWNLNPTKWYHLVFQLRYLGEPGTADSTKTAVDVYLDDVLIASLGGADNSYGILNAGVLLRPVYRMIKQADGTTTDDRIRYVTIVQDY